MASAERDPAALIVSATGRRSLRDAIGWLAEDHPVPPETDWPALLQAIVELGDGEAGYDAAVRRVVRSATASDIDTSRILLDIDRVTTPQQYREALDTLLAESPDGTFGRLTARGVHRAQTINPLAIDALCLAVGVTSRDAKEWFGVSGTWTQIQISGLLSHLTSLVDGSADTAVPDAIVARAPELVFGLGRGWAYLDALRAGGVPYEVLLTQRAAGGPWHAHKNATSGRLNHAAAHLLCSALLARGVTTVRATTAGGTARQRDLQELSGIADKRIGVVALRHGRPTYAVVFSSAHDGGTARANGDGLLQIPRTSLPTALVLGGTGWAGRVETVRLARRFNGLLFTERTLPALADRIAAA